jgi:L-lactate dehydrogenase complex protein LldG
VDGGAAGVDLRGDDVGRMPAASQRDTQLTTTTGSSVAAGCLDGVALVERFAERITGDRTTVHHTTACELPAILSSIIDDHAHRRVVVPMAIDDTWLIQLHDRMQVCSDIARFSDAELETFDVVITGAAAAIAESGTIVLDHRRDQGRRALTLVPPHHLCVLRTDQIVSTEPEALARLDPSQPVSFVSGPSPAPEVERGRFGMARGPRALDVVVLDAS